MSEWDEMQSGVEVEKKKRKTKLSKQIIAANERMFLEECKVAGVDPAKGVSPSLLKIIMTAG